MDVIDTDHCDIGELSDSEAVSDDDIDSFVLYADIDPTDKEAIKARKEEWESLFRIDQ